MRRRETIAIAFVVLLGCRAPPVVAPKPDDRVAIVGSERGPHGVRLVSIDEHGDRRFVVCEASGPGVVRDVNPAISPDGAWIVFASSRDRSFDETSLWIARLGVQAHPVRLTRTPGIDSHPTWTPDGAAIVFASTRAGPTFDLWRLAIADGRARGEPEQLTTGAGHEITPSVARDGAIVYAEVVPKDAGAVESHLEVREPDGTIRVLTDGPADSSPAVSPDGATIAFARPVVRGRSPDSELWRMARDGSDAKPVIALPLTDESGPVWSPDGRYLFATSVLRGEGGRPLFSSIIHVDLGETPSVARMLEDHAGAIARFTPALTRTPLDHAALHADPEYLPELARIMATAIAEQRAAK